VGQAIEVDTPPARNAANVDENIRSDTVYDVVGNVIAAIDPLGVVTRTYYDANRRPVTVVQNLVGQTIEVSTPPGRNPAVPDENLRTDMVYDELGNPIATIDPLGLITRTYYDGLSRSVTVVQNLVGQAIEAGTPPARDPANPDQNVRTDSVYDASGQAIAKVDPLGKITRAYFDNLSRPVSTVQNLVGQAIEVDTPRRGIQPIPIRTPAPIRPTTWLAIRLRLSTPWARSRAPTTMDSTAR
jgi:YD repeat-containing protein